MYELDKTISSKYKIDVKSTVPFKDACIIHTPNTKKILKKTAFTPERILFIHGAKEHLYNNGFTNIDRYICTSDDMPYVNIDGINFTLTEAITGMECNLDNRNHVICAARLLASMHKASKGYKPFENSRAYDELGKLPVYFCKRLDEIKKLKKIAKKGHSKFNCMFLDNADYFIEQAVNSINMIYNSRYNEIVDDSRKEGILCHHDYTHNNIIINDEGNKIINFDFCCFELKVYDLANFLRRKMRKCNWDINEAMTIIDEYRTIEKISSDEFLIMKALLQFPQKFWRVVNKYYNSKHSWFEKNYIAKLQEVIDEIEGHRYFIDSFNV